MRRALLIGADPLEIPPEARLVGIANDLARVEAALARHGFSCRILHGAAATRDGILAALHQLTKETAPDDVVLVYYSGHGGRAYNPDHGAVTPPEPRFFHYIVPADHSSKRFRGIFSVELSALIAGLTARTPNVTVVLDCCHATGAVMSGRRYRTRALPRPWTGDIAGFVTWLRNQGYDLSLADVLGNKHAVRLVACGARETASEYQENGDSGGLLTRAFVAQLDAALGVDPPPIWAAMGAQIRATVSAELPVQNPDVLGPVGRRLFTLDATETRDIFPTFVDAGYTFLDGGALHGIRVGDRFLVLPLNVATPDRERALAELEADLVGEHVTRVKRTDFFDRPPAPPGARAIRTHRVLRRHRVALTGAAANRSLVAAIAQSPRLAVFGPEGPAQPVLATVAGDARVTTIFDADGIPVRGFPADEFDGWARAIVRVCEQLARVRELLDLRGGEGSLALTPPVVTWSLVSGEELPDHGARLKAGDRFFVTVRQPRSRALYVSVLGVLPDRSIALLSASEPQGLYLPQGAVRVVGQDGAGRVVGVPIPWPDSVPAVPQPLEILVVATDVSVDLRPLTADLHDVTELLARVGKRVVYLGDQPPAPRECRVAVVRRSAPVYPGVTAT